MRDLIRRILITTLTLFVISYFTDGLTVSGGLAGYLYASALLSIFILILDPVVRTITMPFNILTLGLLSFLSTFAGLFVLTIFYKNIVVSEFTLYGVPILGVSGGIEFSIPLSYIVISATIYFLNRFFDWVFNY